LGRKRVWSRAPNGAVEKIVGRLEEKVVVAVVVAVGQSRGRARKVEDTTCRGRASFLWEEFLCGRELVGGGGGGGGGGAVVVREFVTTPSARAASSNRGRRGGGGRSQRVGARAQLRPSAVQKQEDRQSGGSAGRRLCPLLLVGISNAVHKHTANPAACVSWWCIWCDVMRWCLLDSTPMSG
jgi:hypothetical protein